MLAYACTNIEMHAVLFPIHIYVFESSGFRAFLSPATFPFVGLQYFAFHSNVNAPIQLLQNGRFEGVATKADHNGYWLFDVQTIHLHAGDVINYWAYVEVNGVGYKIDSRTFMVYAEGLYICSSMYCAFQLLQIIIFAMPFFHFPLMNARADILPSHTRYAVSHYDEIQNSRQNQIFDNQIHHHKVNYYKFSGECVSYSANTIQLRNFNETLVELDRGTNQLHQMNEKISRLNSLFSGLRADDRQRINYFLTDMMRISYANTLDIR